MALIANRVKTKSHLAELLKLLLFGLRKSLSGLLVIVCLLFLFSNSKIVSSVALEVVGRVVDTGALVYQTVFEKVAFVVDRFSYYRNLETENTRLRIELSNTRDLYIKAQTSITENRSLKELLNVVETKESPFLTTKLLSVSISPFSSTAIISAGSNQSVEEDDIVGSTTGLVGRVIAVSPNYSTVRLLDDMNSRVPVITSNTKLRGILARQEDSLKIIYLDEDSQPEINEVVYTSGDGKIFPDGLKVGVIRNINSAGVTISLDLNFRKLDYVYVQKIHK